MTTCVVVLPAASVAVIVKLFSPGVLVSRATKLQVQTASVEDSATFKPVVMVTETGDAIIWVVDTTPDGGKKKKKDGEHSEETLTQDPPVEGKQGEL